MEKPTTPPRPSDDPRLERRETTHRDPNRNSTAFALAGIAGIALLAVLAIAITWHKPAAEPEKYAFADKPSQSRITECNQYAAQVAGGSGAIGGSTSVRDDDPNLVGLSDENRYSDAARIAYRDCMLGIQHDS